MKRRDPLAAIEPEKGKCYEPLVMMAHVSPSRGQMFRIPAWLRHHKMHRLAAIAVFHEDPKRSAPESFARCLIFTLIYYFGKSSRDATIYIKPSAAFPVLITNREKGPSTNLSSLAGEAPALGNVELVLFRIC